MINRASRVIAAVPVLRVRFRIVKSLAGLRRGEQVSPYIVSGDAVIIIPGEILLGEVNIVIRRSGRGAEIVPEEIGYLRGRYGTIGPAGPERMLRLDRGHIVLSLSVAVLIVVAQIELFRKLIRSRFQLVFDLFRNYPVVCGFCRRVFCPGGHARGDERHHHGKRYRNSFFHFPQFFLHTTIPPVYHLCPGIPGLLFPVFRFLPFPRFQPRTTR